MKAFSTREIVQDQLDKKRLGHNPSWFKVVDMAPLVRALEAIVADKGNFDGETAWIGRMHSIAQKALEDFRVS